MATATTSPPLESWRVFFPAAAALAVGGLGVWIAQLQGVAFGITPRDHGAFMLWGVLGTGIFGFLLTAYAKQNDAALPARPLLLGLLAAQGIAAPLILAGHAAPALVPWSVLLGWTLRVAIPSLRRRLDPTTAAVPAVVASGLVGLAVHVGGGNGTAIGVNAFVAPLALAIVDRVLPFFSSRVTPGYAGRRLPWFVGPMFVLSWLRLTPWAPWAAAGLLLLLARQVWGWRPWPAAKTPMILVLYLGVAWFAVSWVLALGGASASVVTHALVVGGLGSLLLAISMRVVRGHGGLPLELGRTGVVVMVLAQAAAVARISGAPLWLAGTLLAGAFSAWLLRFVRVCLPAPG